MNNEWIKSFDCHEMCDVCKECPYKNTENSKCVYDRQQKYATVYIRGGCRMNIYVVDTETTGLVGAPFDLVVEIGIVEADLTEKTVTSVYSAVVGYDTSKWPESVKSSWIFENSDLSVREVSLSTSVKTVARDVRLILSGQICTSYNVPFDFGKFLCHDPWNVSCTLAPDIMTAAYRLVKGDRTFEDGTCSWPKLDKAYAELCPEDPAGLHGSQRHRALSDAEAAAYVMLALADLDAYPVPEASP